MNVTSLCPQVLSPSHKGNRDQADLRAMANGHREHRVPTFTSTLEIWTWRCAPNSAALWSKELALHLVRVL